ncbi:MAG TPA: DUF885 domain-containing protein [Thermomicrobiales bacterium]|nr:DUF885 domain-containing protein [Thermomicrobiales bacterium]
MERDDASARALRFTPHAPRPTAPAFAAWLDDFFAAHYRRRPVDATFIGVHEYDDRLPDFSEAGAGDTLAELLDLERRLAALPPEPLAPAEALDRRLAAGCLAIGRWECDAPHGHRGNPCVYTGEAIFGVIALFLRPFAPLAERVEAAIARLGAIPALLAQGERTVRAAPPAWTARAVDECDGALAFLRGGVDILCRDEGLADPRLRAAADVAAAVFADFRHYLETDPRARPVANYACGADALDLLLRRGHFLDRDAATIAAYAREQFAAARADLAAHARDFGARTWPEALALLADHHPPAEGYEARFGELWDAARAAAEEHNLLTWPDAPLRYVPQPAWAREAAPHLYFLPYRSPAPFDRLPVTDYLVPPLEPDLPPAERERRLRAVNDSVIKLNHVVHHGGIGHHVQNWHARRAASRVGRVAATDCAARIAFLCGGTMAEGWACYATDLMDEIGFTTPLEHYAQRYARLRMAARAIADVGLHTGALSLEDVIALYRDEVGMAPGAARAEAVKNSLFPGAALMYLVGTDLIHDLRRAVAAREGAAFDLRRFHDRFLAHGAVPVALIREAMLDVGV